MQKKELVSSLKERHHAYVVLEEFDKANTMMAAIKVITGEGDVPRVGKKTPHSRNLFKSEEVRKTFAAMAAGGHGRLNAAEVATKVAKNHGIRASGKVRNAIYQHLVTLEKEGKVVRVPTGKRNVAFRLA